MKLADTVNSIFRIQRPTGLVRVSRHFSFDALAMMAEHEIGALLVISDNRPAGIFSERDYARKVILQGKSSKLSKSGKSWPAR